MRPLLTSRQAPRLHLVAPLIWGRPLVRHLYGIELDGRGLEGCWDECATRWRKHPLLLQRFPRTLLRHHYRHLPPSPPVMLILGVWILR